VQISPSGTYFDEIQLRAVKQLIQSTLPQEFGKSIQAFSIQSFRDRLQGIDPDGPPFLELTAFSNSNNLQLFLID
jgi:hypothetical protein